MAVSMPWNKSCGRGTGTRFVITKWLWGPRNTPLPFHGTPVTLIARYHFPRGQKA